MSWMKGVKIGRGEIAIDVEGLYTEISDRKREELEEGESVLQKQVEYVREMQAQLLDGKVDHNMIQKKADEELEERDRKVLRILKAKDQKVRLHLTVSYDT